VFFPNDDYEGLKHFSTGFGGGVEARFNVVSTTTLGVYVGPEMDYIGFSKYSQTYRYSDGYNIYTMEDKEKFSTQKVKGNFLFSVPIQKFSIFFGASPISIMKITYHLSASLFTINPQILPVILLLRMF
jgi:hypothetical protein